MTEKKQKKQGKAMTRKTATGQADQKRDINSKSVLGNPILYAQFLRDNIDIPCLKNVQPEDIEDVSERYRPYLGTEFESDTVKRVRIHGDNAADSDNRLQEPLFLISLTEHKSQVDYDVSMQLLKYMLCIWLDYGKEKKAEKAGASDRKSFRYPAIIPIVYYEGKAAWTAARDFRSRIAGGELFRKWIPDFTYEVVRLHDYSNEELLSRGDEISLIMLFNKIQDDIDLSEFLKLPQERLDEIIKDTPEAILDIIVSAMETLCGKIDATEEETRKCVNRVKERKMGYLWENMEKMSIQEERRNTAQARAEAEKAKAEAESAKAEAESAKAEAESTKAEFEKAKVALKLTEEDKIKSVINICKYLKASNEQTVSETMSECSLDQETARQKVDLYWNI